MKISNKTNMANLTNLQIIKLNVDDMNLIDSTGGPQALRNIIKSLQSRLKGKMLSTGEVVAEEL